MTRMACIAPRRRSYKFSITPVLSARCQVCKSFTILVSLYSLLFWPYIISFCGRSYLELLLHKPHMVVVLSCELHLLEGDVPISRSSLPTSTHLHPHHFAHCWSGATHFKYSGSLRIRRLFCVWVSSIAVFIQTPECGLLLQVAGR